MDENPPRPATRLARVRYPDGAVHEERISVVGSTGEPASIPPDWTIEIDLSHVVAINPGDLRCMGPVAAERTASAGPVICGQPAVRLVPLCDGHATSPPAREPR